MRPEWTRGGQSQCFASQAQVLVGTSKDTQVLSQVPNQDEQVPYQNQYVQSQDIRVSSQV